MRNTLLVSIAGVIFSAVSAIAATDCLKVAATTKSLIENTPENVLAVVEVRTKEFPTCACEIVKTAIQTTHADVELVARIVETAILAAPEQMRMIAQCAIAVAPDALPAIQGVLARLDPHSGESYSSKSSAKRYSGKGAKEVSPMQEEASIANPLDFPGTGPVGPMDGLFGGALMGWDPFTDPFFPGGFPTGPPPTDGDPVPPIPPVDPPVETPVSP